MTKPFCFNVCVCVCVCVCVWRHEEREVADFILAHVSGMPKIHFIVFWKHHQFLPMFLWWKILLCHSTGKVLLSFQNWMTLNLPMFLAQAEAWVNNGWQSIVFSKTIADSHFFVSACCSSMLTSCKIKSINKKYFYIYSRGKGQNVTQCFQGRVSPLFMNCPSALFIKAGECVPDDIFWVSPCPWKPRRKKTKTINNRGTICGSCEFMCVCVDKIGVQTRCFAHTGLHRLLVAGTQLGRHI